MALVQTIMTDKKGGTDIMQEDAEGFGYKELVGGIRVYSGAGAPAHGSTANPVPLGSMCFNRTNGTWYRKTSTTTDTTWTLSSA